MRSEPRKAKPAEGGHTHSVALPFALLVLSCVLVVLSIAAQGVFGLALFSRSGSLMVLCAVMAEYILLRGRDDHHGRQLTRAVRGETTDFSHVHPSRRHYVLEIGAHICTVVGTIIWGYGDLLY